MAIPLFAAVVLKPCSLSIAARTSLTPSSSSTTRMCVISQPGIGSALTIDLYQVLDGAVALFEHANHYPPQAQIVAETGGDGIHMSKLLDQIQLSPGRQSTGQLHALARRNNDVILAVDQEHRASQPRQLTALQIKATQFLLHCSWQLGEQLRHKPRIAIVDQIIDRAPLWTKPPDEISDTGRGMGLSQTFPDPCARLVRGRDDLTFGCGLGL